MTPSLPGRVGFAYHDGHLHCEEVTLASIAERFGTPTYVYSRQAIEAAFDAYAKALSGRKSLVCYAVKANSNLAVLDLLARRGAGFDIVSGGELARVLAAGADPAKIVFSGVGKRESEIQQALEAQVLCFNIESIDELDRIDAVAQRLGKIAPVSVRVNPDVDAGTHPYISTGLKTSKFGVAYADALPLYRDAAQRAAIAVVGIDCHIGSQITEVAPYLDAAGKLLDLADILAGEQIRLQHIDFGGGLGIRYREENPPPVHELIEGVLKLLAARGHADVTVMFEPGRSIVGNAGALLTRVEYLKRAGEKNFAIVDAAMNDLLRPAMYDAWMSVVEVNSKAGKGAIYDIVGPVCESGDWLAHDRELMIAPQDLLAIMSAGAYGMVMSSNYNTRPRAAEVMVDGGSVHCVRLRETVESLFAGECKLPSA